MCQSQQIQLTHEAMLSAFPSSPLEGSSCSQEGNFSSQSANAAWFGWIGSSPPAALSLPSAGSSHKEQQLYQILIPGDSASLGLIARIRRKCKSAEGRGCYPSLGTAPLQQHSTAGTQCTQRMKAQEHKHPKGLQDSCRHSENSSASEGR